MSTREEQLRLWLTQKQQAKQRQPSTSVSTLNNAQTQRRSATARKAPRTRQEHIAMMSQQPQHQQQQLQTPQQQTGGRRRVPYSTTRKNRIRGGAERPDVTPKGHQGVPQTPVTGSSRRAIRRTNVAADAYVTPMRGPTTSRNYHSAMRSRTRGMPSTAKRSNAAAGGARRQHVPSTIERGKRATARATNTAAEAATLEECRRSMSALETVLLQWTLANVRMQSAVQQRTADAHRRLFAVWHDVNECRAATLQIAIELRRERYMRQVSGAVEMQRKELLPMEDAFNLFEANYAQLIASVERTSNMMPVDENLDLTTLEEDLQQLVQHSIPNETGPQNLGQLSSEMNLLLVTCTQEQEELEECNRLMLRFCKLSAQSNSLAIHTQMQQQQHQQQAEQQEQEKQYS